MPNFKLKDKVLVLSVPQTMLSFRKSLGKVVGKTVEITDIERRPSGFWYLVNFDSKQVWLPELSLQESI